MGIKELDQEGVVPAVVAVQPRVSLVPYVALALGLAGMSASAIFVKWANAPGIVTGFYRVFIAAAVMAPFFAIRVQRERPLAWRHVGIAVLAGVIFAANLTCWNTAVMIGNAANATLFGNTSPIWVAIGATVFFREKLPLAFWGALGIAFVGVVIILGADFLTHPALGAGDLLALFGGVFYGMFFLATQGARRGLGSLTSWWIAAASTSVVLLLLALLLGLPLSGYPAESVASMVALALVTQVAGWLALNYALGHLPASLVSPTLLAQPVITAILAVPLLGQPISVVQVIGGGIVLGGILAVHRSRAR